MQDFKKLKVWEEAHQMTLQIYKLTKGFPKEESFGLSSQLRRSSSSIGANLSEGCGRSSRTDFARFAQIAFGSACESEYHLILARDLGYLTTDQFTEIEKRLVGIKKMLTSLIKKLRTENR